MCAHNPNQNEQELWVSEGAQDKYSNHGKILKGRDLILIEHLSFLESSKQTVFSEKSLSLKSLTIPTSICKFSGRFPVVPYVASVAPKFADPPPEFDVILSPRSVFRESYQQRLLSHCGFDKKELLYFSSELLSLYSNRVEIYIESFGQSALSLT